MVVTSRPSARNAGTRQLCTGSPSMSTVQAPQSPASQPFLTPNQPSWRRKVRRHWPAARLRGKFLAVDQIAHRGGSGQFAADLLGKMQRHVAPPFRQRRGCRRSSRRRESRARCAQRRSCADGSASNESFTGRGVDGGDGEREGAVFGARVPISSAPERPSGASEICRNAVRRVSASAGNVIERKQFAGLEHIALRAGDEFGDRHAPLAAVRRPDRADAVERGGERDHRAGRQRHADIAADGRRVPDFEGGEEGAAALADQRRGDPFDRAGEAVELRDGAGGGDVEPVGAGLQRLPAERGEIDQPRQPRLRLGKQPGAAAEPGIAGAPGRQFAASRAAARPR